MERQHPPERDGHREARRDCWPGVKTDQRERDERREVQCKRVSGGCCDREQDRTRNARVSDRGTKNRRKGGESEKSTERGWNKDENIFTKEAIRTPGRHVRRSQLERD